MNANDKILQKYLKEENYKVKLNKTRRGWVAKGMILGTLALGGLVASTTQANADEWIANTPEQIAQRIAAHNASGDQSITFEKGDTIWNLGLALNIKDPMQLLYQNGYKDGDQYTLKEGIKVSWNGNYVEIQNEQNETIGAGYIAPEAKINPQQPVVQQQSDVVQVANKAIVQPKAPSEISARRTPANQTTTITKDEQADAKAEENQAKANVDQAKETLKDLENQLKAEEEKQNQSSNVKEDINQTNEEIAKTKAELENAEISIKKINIEYEYLSVQLATVNSKLEEARANFAEARRVLKPEIETSPYLERLKEDIAKYEAEQAELNQKVKDNRAAIEAYKNDEIIANLHSLEDRLQKLQSIDQSSSKVEELQQAVYTQKANLAKALSQLVEAKMRSLKADTMIEVQEKTKGLTDQAQIDAIVNAAKENYLAQMRSALTDFSTEYDQYDLTNKELNDAITNSTFEITKRLDEYAKSLKENVETPVEEDQTHEETKPEKENPTETETQPEQPEKENPTETETQPEQPAEEVDQFASIKQQVSESIKQLEHLTQPQLNNYLTALNDAKTIDEISNIRLQAVETDEQNLKDAQEAERKEQERLAAEKAEQERLAAEKAAQEKAEQERLAALNDAKTKAKEVLNTLTDLNETELNGFTSEVMNAQSIEAINQLLVDATGLNNANKIKNEAAKSLNNAKRQALTTISNLNHLDAQTKNTFVQKLQKSIDVNEIAIIVSDATAKDRELELKAENEAKLKETKASANQKLQQFNLKEQLSEYQSKIENAQSIEDVIEIVKQAEQLSNENAQKDQQVKALNDAKTNALNELKALTRVDTTTYQSRIENAQSVDEIQHIVNEAKAAEAKVIEEANKPKPVSSNSILTNPEAKRRFILTFTQLLNDFRKENGLKEIYSTTLLNRAADIRSEDEKNGLISMYQNGQTTPDWDHSRPDGSGTGRAVSQAASEGYNLAANGLQSRGMTHNWVNENIAINYQMPKRSKDTPEAVAQRVFTQWKNSAGHRKNMLSPRSDVFGIGLWGDPSQSGPYIEFTFISGEIYRESGFTLQDIQLFQ